MNWSITYSEKANNDIRDILYYIKNILLSENIAIKQINKILDYIDKLDNMPMRQPISEIERLKNLGVRKLLVDNYTVFYYPNEDTNEVVILRVVYSGRNIEEIEIT